MLALEVLETARQRLGVREVERGLDADDRRAGIRRGRPDGARARRTNRSRVAGRMDHRDELEGVLSDWIAARPSADVLAAFEAAHAAAAPV
jgi:crotonobetainyl-CoA:carnitine CoA-transferase CaiB-like acyl-CoA transferase